MKKRFIIFLFLCYCSGLKALSDFNDVASIFYNRCTSCHHLGGAAGFSLMTYADVNAYYLSIQTDLITDHMPPWLPDTTYTASAYPTKRFLHEQTITLAEKNRILQWINDGVQEGNPALLPAPPVYGNNYELNGNASLTLQIPTFTSNSTISNPNPFNCFSISTGLLTDRWLRAFEIVAGNISTVHHVVITIDTTGTVSSDLSGTCYNPMGEIYLGRWTPGMAHTVYPNAPALKAGLRIPAGSNLIMRIEYSPNSVGLSDSTKIRMFFYPTNETGIRPIHSDIFMQYWGVPAKPDIAANTLKTFTITPAYQTQPHSQPPANDISLFSITPHSNNICIKLKNYAVNGSDTIPLLRIKEWYYQWQANYVFQNLVKIPTGYTLQTEHSFDNTLNNQHQPSNPPVNVNFGTGKANEMIYDAVQWLDYQTGDELIDIKALLAADSLFMVGIKDISTPSFQSFIYPNPASDKLSIYLSKKSDYSGRIYSLTGQTIMQFENFRDALTVDIKGIPQGLYIVEITDIISKERIAKKIVISN